MTYQITDVIVPRKSGLSRETFFRFVVVFCSFAGDSMSYSDGMAFSTLDVDNDDWSSTNCADVYGAAWWFKSCSISNLNAFAYGNGTGEDKMFWWHFENNEKALRSSVMKIIRTA